MRELLLFLHDFSKILNHQLFLFQEFLPLLDKEEEFIRAFRLTEFEKVVTEKDQHSRLLQRVENKRASILKKICYFIGFDTRGREPSLDMFLVAFQNYLQTVEKLLDAETFAELTKIFHIITQDAEIYKKKLVMLFPKIERNKKVLSKLKDTYNKSLHIYLSFKGDGQGYDSLGNNFSKTALPHSAVSLNVKV